jgi:hypothetical protein
MVVGRAATEVSALRVPAHKLERARDCQRYQNIAGGGVAHLRRAVGRQFRPGWLTGARGREAKITSAAGAEKKPRRRLFVGARSAWSGQMGTGNCEGHSQLVADEPTS